jgi:hypothetical protein
LIGFIFSLEKLHLPQPERSTFVQSLSVFSKMSFLLSFGRFAAQNNHEAHPQIMIISYMGYDGE